MRSLMCILASSALAASASVIVSGCDSSSNSPAGGDSGSTDASSMAEVTATAPTDAGANESGADGDATTGTGGDSGDAAVADGPTCVQVDASVATVAAGAQWGCFQSACATQLSECASDCTCNAAIFGALLCAANGAPATECFTAEIAQHIGDTAVVLVGNCLQTTTRCSGGGGADGSSEAGDGASEAGSDAGAEAGLDGSDAATSD